MLQNVASEDRNVWKIGETSQAIVFATSPAEKTIHQEATISG